MPYDKTDPSAGGWTILANLHPLCSYHHHAKTLRLWSCAKLDGNAIYWQCAAGLHRITPPTHGTVAIPDDFTHHTRYRQPVPLTPETGVEFMVVADVCVDNNPGDNTGDHNSDAPDPDDTDQGPDAPSDELFEPTWWETNISDRATNWYRLLNPDASTGAPTLRDIAGLTDPLARADASYLRGKFLEHRAIVAQRHKYRPPPF